MRFITCRSAVKPRLVKYFKWLLKVTKGWQSVHSAFRPVHKGHIRSPKGTVPFGSGIARTVVINRFVFFKYGGHSVQLT